MDTKNLIANLRKSGKMCILVYMNNTPDCMKTLREFRNLRSLVKHFATNEISKKFLAQLRWGDDVVCPHCGKHHCTQRTDGRYRCNQCKHNFSVITGTIFEGTKVELVKWFMAMYLVSSHKKGISSYQLGRDIGVSQNTAWYMLQKIRCLFKQDDSVALRGIVECDEVYIGGKEKWKHKSMHTPHTQGRSTKTKTPVFGMLERITLKDEHGNDVPFSIVRAMKVSDTTSKTLLPIIGQFVERGSMVITDELTSYNKLASEGYTHEVVHHKNAEFAHGNISSNGIEGFWTHFRRMMIGCYHNVSDEHLQAYIDECCFRWNTRKASQEERFVYMFEMSVGIVKTKEVFKLCSVH